MLKTIQEMNTEQLLNLIRNNPQFKLEVQKLGKTYAIQYALAFLSMPRQIALQGLKPKIYREIAPANVEAVDIRSKEDKLQD